VYGTKGAVDRKSLGTTDLKGALNSDGGTWSGYVCLDSKSTAIQQHYVVPTGTCFVHTA
jgi:hypothetical protein